jgi:hypothetical protein
MSNKSSGTRTRRTLINRDSESGRFLDVVKKDIHESVDLYFRPMRVLANEFTKASATRPKRSPSTAR